MSSKPGLHEATKGARKRFLAVFSPQHLRSKQPLGLFQTVSRRGILRSSQQASDGDIMLRGGKTRVVRGGRKGRGVLLQTQALPSLALVHRAGELTLMEAAIVSLRSVLGRLGSS
jgi:hypothetical protein